VVAAADEKKPTIKIVQSTTKTTNKSYKLNLLVTDASGVSSVKWAVGSKTTSYFSTSGKALKLNADGKVSVTVSKNSIYTFYAKDKAGNITIKKITVTNIDTAKPVIAIKKSTSANTNRNVKLNLTVTDVGQGIVSIKYLVGTKYTADFKNAGKAITFTKTGVVEDKLNNNQYTYSASLSVNANKVITFLVEDGAGNKTLKRITVSNIDKTAPVLTYSLSTKLPTNSSLILNIAATDEGFGVNNVVYLTGVKTFEDFSNNTSVKTLSLNQDGKGKLTVTKNGNFTFLVTDTASNQTLLVVKITNIDTVLPILQLDYSVMNQSADITIFTKDSGSGIKRILYLKGKITDAADSRWESKGIDVTKEDTITATSSGNYSVLAEDKAGNKTIQVMEVELEFKAVWISYLEFLEYGKGGFTKESFEKTVNSMFDNIVSMNMNAVVVQVRPFGDAMYESSYFPWSKYISGTQGVDPGFDPLTYMVAAAHKRGLSIHAWLNPYRVTTASTDYTALSKDNPARIWQEDSNTTNARNVLSYGGNLYYNPAVKEVQNLIINGIKEIVENYDVDGIHFDDYFYPTLGSGYEKNFDSIEYSKYADNLEAAGKNPLSIADWRRNNINTLIKNVYSSIKKIDSNVEFGISPAGNYNTLLSDTAYYTDIETWLSTDGYIDYICPQIYWTFSHSSYPFDKTLDQWLAYRTSSSVKVYVGIATYKSGSSLEHDWRYDDEVMKNQVEYGRDTGLVDGFIFFRYDFFYDNKVTEPGVNKLLEIL
jgi:uncharacterized lipoprotein YddW (UPF0748 family)